MKRILLCKRCGHIWTVRIKGYPKSCPKCKSYAWDKPKYDNKCNTCDVDEPTAETCRGCKRNDVMEGL